MTREAVARPLVSILTPSFNQVRWLRDNLASVQAQTYPRIEHIVMDGGSSDGSVESLVATAGPNVHWRSEPDGGQSDAINKAFAASSGDIIGWLNSDDAYFAADAVERAVEVLAADDGVGLVYGHSALVNASGTLLYVLWAPPYSRRRLRTFNFINQPSVFLRRTAIGRDRLVDPECDYAMDRELWMHMAESTRFARINRVIAIDRHHMQRKSYTRLDLLAHDDALIAERYGVVRGRFTTPTRKAIKLGMRLAGLSKVAEASRGGPVVAPSPALGIAFRQAAQLRRWMPADGDAERAR